MPVTFRRAIPADGPSLRDAIIAAYAIYDNAGIELPPVADGLIDDIRDRDVWIAEEGGQLLGGVVVDLGRDSAHLMNVAVHPDASGRGLGRKLIEKAEAIAADAGREKMNLATHRDLAANISLYQHLGWNVVSEERTKVTMEKEIGPTKGKSK